MKIGIISDTHDQVDKILKMVEVLNQEQVELVIHCGDWVAPFTLKFYEDLKCPIKGVFGNNDGDKFRHLTFSQTLGFDISYEERFLELELDKRKIAAFHGDYQGLVNSLVESGKYDVVFHGHTHIKVNETIGKTLSLNPGALISTRKNDFKPSIAIYDTQTNTAKHINL